MSGNVVNNLSIAQNCSRIPAMMFMSWLTGFNKVTYFSQDSFSRATLKKTCSKFEQVKGGSGAPELLPLLPDLSSHSASVGPQMPIPWKGKHICGDLWSLTRRELLGWWSQGGSSLSNKNNMHQFLVPARCFTLVTKQLFVFTTRLRAISSLPAPCHPN